MPRDAKKRHKANAYGDFLRKRGAKIAAGMAVSSCEYRFLDSPYEYGVTTARAFSDDLRKKRGQIEAHPFSCAVDQVYPSLMEKGIRKAIINKNRFLLLYMIKEEQKKIIIITIERAERDYITTFEENLRIYNEADKRDG